MPIRSEDRVKFVPAGCEESSDALSNPACGWYHVYTFLAQPPAEGQPVDKEIWLDESCRQERLALVLVDIGAFCFAPLSAAALQHIGQIVAFFRGQQKQLLLRFAYDTQGKASRREPASLARIKEHMAQIGRVIAPYLDDILVMQGIFVGNWGEMHGSRFLDRASMCELVSTLYRVTQGRCFLAVRTPAQWREITGSPRISSRIAARLGLFNDGIFGSPTDLGTYGTLPGAGKTEKRSRSEELAWQDRHLGMVPNGGEILSGRPLKSFRQAEQDLRKMHVSYLNSVYHPQQLAHWKQETAEGPGCWQGVSGYDYIGRHLGYRFSVLDVREARGQKLQITIKNSGFGNLYQAADCFLVTETGQGTICRQRLHADAGAWKSGQTAQLSLTVPRKERRAGSRLYLLLQRQADGHILRFANRGAGDSVLLGEFR